MLSWNTLRIRKNIIGQFYFRMNYELSSKNTRLNTMNVIFGNRIAPFQGFGSFVPFP
jgi:hypothetical protein